MCRSEKQTCYKNCISHKNRAYYKDCIDYINYALYKDYMSYENYIHHQNRYDGQKIYKQKVLSNKAGT